MADIVPFVRRADIAVSLAMEEFIALSRDQLTVFGPDLDFDSDSWDVSKYFPRQARRSKVRLNFTTLASCASSPAEAMGAKFKNFAKAYVRYRHGTRSTQNVGMQLMSLRVLEAALLETGEDDPTRVDAHVLNRASQLSLERWRPGVAYEVASRLQMIAEFLREHHLSVVPIDWKHPVRRPVTGVRVGRTADELRQKMMPSQAALDALPQIFRSASISSDVLVSSVAAILCSAPDRISELLSLPYDCQVSAKSAVQDTAYGLRWWPVKGAEPMIKWIIPSMAGVVKMAIAKISSLTEEARSVAEWYERNPGKIYLSGEFEYLRSREWISLAEAARIIFVELPSDDNGVVLHWLRKNEVAVSVVGSNRKVRIRDVEAAVVSQLPAGFPYLDGQSGLRYRDALFIMRANELHSTACTLRPVIEPIRHCHIHNRLGQRSRFGVASVFDRAGFYEPDGTPIRISTHQFRHYLNTLAQAGGLGQLDIAKWSGRATVSQNYCYDHESPEAVVARIRNAVGDDARMFGPLSAPLRAVPISRDEFSRLKVPTAHTTDFGYCIHDFVMSPCQLHRDCLGCSEQVCLKGEDAKEANLRRAYGEATALLKMAAVAAANGDLGAEQWVEQHQMRVDQLHELLAIYDDPTVPTGTFIQLTLDGPSQMERALNSGRAHIGGGTTNPVATGRRFK